MANFTFKPADWVPYKDFDQRLLALGRRRHRVRRGSGRRRSRQGAARGARRQQQQSRASPRGPHEVRVAQAHGSP